jgi:hypothetical protein
VGLSSYGFAQYRETLGCLSWACRLDEAFDVGFNLKWMQRSIGKAGPDGVVSIDGGLLARPVSDISVEMSIRNLNAPTLGVEPVPQDLVAGIIYQPAPGLRTGINLLKHVDHPVQLSIGEEFCLSQWFVQRVGIRRNPTQISFGFGLEWSRLQIDYATVIHPTLGMTHSFSLSMMASHDG